LIFVGAEGGLLDHLMKQAVQAAIEEAKEQRSRGTGLQLNYVWDETKFETRGAVDPKEGGNYGAGDLATRDCLRRPGDQDGVHNIIQLYTVVDCQSSIV
jgi:hypothetical protein